jgi:hypothetical protein
VSGKIYSARFSPGNDAVRNTVCRECRRNGPAAAPQRDGVVIGYSASTAIADVASLYLRYEGEIAGQDSSHALIAGLRMTW